VRKCSQPNESLKELYEALRFKTQPFTKRKPLVHKTELQKIKPPDLQVVIET
jgi:hypothetical protein